MPGSLEKSETAGLYGLRLCGGSSVFAGGRNPFLASSARAPPSPISPPRLLPDPSGPGSPAQGGLRISPPPRSAGPVSPGTLEPGRKRGGAGRWGCVGRRRCWVL
ncbi:hypothetical protein LEMLEM_LOCUS27603 [Lemmus lemmus]